jgi:hypothetical protein
MNGVSHFDNGRRLGRRASFVLLVCANVPMMATAGRPQAHKRTDDGRSATSAAGSRHHARYERTPR